MKVNLMTDAPNHNLALMKISAWHKAQGDEVFLNMPLMPVDKTYASWLFEVSDRYQSDVVGGPGFNPSLRLPEHIEAMKPDYDLFPIDYSLGYTWRGCNRHCSFCKVGLLWSDNIHHSIWDFHDEKFKKICLLNNNTFDDPRWRETFDQIHGENLIVRDESGYDVRVLDEEKANTLKRTKFEKGYVHFAWDKMKDEEAVLRGLRLAKDAKLKAMVYVLMGYDTILEQDMYRCQKIHDLGFDPFPMLYKQTDLLKKFRRMIYLRMYRKYKTIKEAWGKYE